MQAVVLSDTHVSPRKVKKTIERLRSYLEKADHILHAGDITCMDFLEALCTFAPVTAVAGNMDGPEVRRELPEQRVVELAGRKIGLTHGWGSPGGVAEKVTARFLEGPDAPGLDAIVFGHTHRALAEKKNDVWLINPGSPTDWFFAPFRSLAILEIDQELDARIVTL